MNRNIKQLINKYSYHRGIELGKELRAKLLNDAETLEANGANPEEIIRTLALPLADDNLTA